MPRAPKPPMDCTLAQSADRRGGAGSAPGRTLGRVLRRALVLAFGCALVSSEGAAKASPTAAGLAEAAGESCVTFHTQVIYNNYGYDHWVHLKSGCTHSVVCRVTSNSNPAGVSSRLKASESKSELLFRGSPASEFSAQVSCRKETN